MTETHDFDPGTTTDPAASYDEALPAYDTFEYTEEDQAAAASWAAGSDSGVSDMAVTDPVWETARADDIGAAVAFADHLVENPYDHPALGGLAGVQATVDQIAGPEAVSEILDQPYVPGSTFDDIVWNQLGLTGYEDLQGFINAQYAYVDQIAATYGPELAAPIPGYEQFFGGLGFQTASGAELVTLGPGSYFGAGHSLSDVLGPTYSQIFP